VNRTPNSVNIRTFDSPAITPAKLELIAAVGPPDCATARLPLIIGRFPLEYMIKITKQKYKTKSRRMPVWGVLVKPEI